MHKDEISIYVYNYIYYTGAMAQSTNSSIDPKVNCTVTSGTTLNCRNTIQPHICGGGSLSITCQTFSYAVQTLAINGTCPSPRTTPTTTFMANDNTPACKCNLTSPSSALGAVIGFLVLLEVGTVIAWVACTITRKRHSKQRC